MKTNSRQLKNCAKNDKIQLKFSHNNEVPHVKWQNSTLKPLWDKRPPIILKGHSSKKYFEILSVYSQRLSLNCRNKDLKSPVNVGVNVIFLWISQMTASKYRTLSVYCIILIY
jgi:hypothetical protein